MDMESLDQLSDQPTSDEKNIALLAHLGTLIGGFIVPLVIYLVKKDESTFITENAKESLNFQISLLIYFIVSGFLFLIFIGFFLMLALGLFSFIVLILAAIASSEGKIYRYPLCIRFIQ